MKNAYEEIGCDGAGWEKKLIRSAMKKPDNKARKSRKKGPAEKAKSSREKGPAGQAE